MSLTTGDTRPDLTGTCWADAAATIPAVLTGATLAIHIKRPDNTVLNKVGVIVVAASGTWKYTWVAGDLNQSGMYKIEVQVTYSDGGIQTFGQPATRYVNLELA